MTTFQRKLDANALSAAKMATAPWLLDLLRHWYPAGHAAPVSDWTAPTGSTRLSGPRPMGLRLAIRNGYMNFYCGGQSIAKVTTGRNLTAKTHEKYLTDAAVDGQRYLQLGGDAPKIEMSMARSHPYQGLEKMFVEQVCAANGTVVDLEMGLPSEELAALKTGYTRRVAPRIDLVALEPVPGGWQVVFWEAKLTSDSRLRSRSETPAVVEQLGNYRDWFAEKACADVLEAYRSACRWLVTIHNLAREMGLSVPPLHASVVAVAGDRCLLKAVDPVVRLLIDNRAHDTHFDREHLPKLERAGVPCRLVRNEADLMLPLNNPSA